MPEQIIRAFSILPSRRVGPVDQFSSVRPFAATSSEMLGNCCILTEAEKDRKNAVSHFRPGINEVYVQRPNSDIRKHLVVDTVQQE